MRSGAASDLRPSPGMPSYPKPTPPTGYWRRSRRPGRVEARSDDIISTGSASAISRGQASKVSHHGARGHHTNRFRPDRRPGSRRRSRHDHDRLRRSVTRQIPPRCCGVRSPRLDPQRSPCRATLRATTARPGNRIARVRPGRWRRGGRDDTGPRSVAPPSSCRRRCRSCTNRWWNVSVITRPLVR
jgi:hypothetical protein